MKGIILAGGSGTRLRPLTTAMSKQLLPVHDKPMIYYPLATLMLTGIREVLVITTPQETVPFERLLRDGSQWGVNVTYATQERPEGIAQAITIGGDFIGTSPVALILGDNIFHGPSLGTSLQRFAEPDGAHVMAYAVADPRDYAVLELDETGRPVSLEEKPASPRSNLAVTGLYFYSADVVDRAQALKPSERGELEITDLNQTFLSEGRLAYDVLPRGTVWMDAGTIAGLGDVSNFVRVVEERQGLKVGCPEEVAWRQEWIDGEALCRLADEMGASPYSAYLRALLNAPREP